MLQLAQGWISVATVVFGALWGLYVYIANEKKAAAIRLEQANAIEKERVVQAERENTTRRIEAQKPFLELQFKTYLKTTALVGRMIHLQRGEDEFKNLKKDFETLYWTELALVEDPLVESAMVKLNRTFLEFEQGLPVADKVKSSALGLAQAMRDSIRNGWRGNQEGS